MFEVTSSHGFHVRFSNGYAFSVQWARGNYCSNRFSHELMPTSATAEIAAWPEGSDNDTFYRFEGADSDVLGWQTADEVVARMAEVAALPAIRTDAEVGVR